MNQRKAGVLLSYAGQIVQILTGLIYTPIMLRILGQSEYGLYQLVYSVVSYLSLLSLGFGSSYMRFYAKEKVNSKDDEGVAKLNGTFLIIFISMSAICLLCGFFMIANIEHVFGKGLTTEEYQKARILMALLVVNMSMTFPNSLFNNIIISQERFVFQKTIILLQYLLNPFIALPLLILGYGSVGMVAVTTFLTAFVLFADCYYCFKIIGAKFKFCTIRASLLLEMATFTFFIFINQIIDQINWSVDSFLIGRILGTVSVAKYGVGAQINMMYIQFSTAVSNVFVPKVNMIVVNTDDNSQLTKLFTKVGRIQFMIMMLILTGFIFFGQSFISFWAGNNYSTSYYVTLLLIIPVTVPLIQNLGIEIQRAKNKHRARSVVYLCIAIANIMISIPLIKQYGPIGAAAGTSLSLIAGNIFFMNWYYHNELGINIIYFWKSISSIIPGLIIPIVVGGISLVTMQYTSFSKWCLCIALYTMIYCICLWNFSMNDEERQLLRTIKKSRSTK